MEDIIVRRIAYDSAEYRSELELRNRILRIPLHMDLFTEDLSIDEPDIHIGAFLYDVLVGVLVLKTVNEASVKMRQVAVDDALQGRGIGKLLVRYAEELAKAEGYGEIRLHARKTAMDFYRKLGYTVTGGEFTEVGIPHVEMMKILH
jgi:predicted GNAT family N-acyltransferase